MASSVTNTLLTLPAPDIDPLTSGNINTSSRSTTTTRAQISTGTAPVLTRPQTQPTTSSSQTSISPSSTTLTTSPINSTSLSNAAAGAPESSGSQSKNQAPVGLIVGLLFGLLIFVALVLFFLRRYLIHRRERRITPTKARIGLAISGPTDFQHITGGLNALTGAQPPPGNRSSSGGVGHPRRAEMSRADLASPYSAPHQTTATTAAVGALGNNPTRNLNASLNRPVDSGRPGGGGAAAGAAEVWATFESESNNTAASAASSSERVRKYSFDFNTLESGLSDHMETMRTGHKSPRLQG